jgi:hypothetical protein
MTAADSDAREAWAELLAELVAFGHYVPSGVQGVC